MFTMMSNCGIYKDTEYHILKAKKSVHIIIIVLLILNHLSIFANEQESLNNHISDLKSSTLSPRSFIKNIYTPHVISRQQQAKYNSNNIVRNLQVAGLFLTLISIFSLSDIIPFFSIAKAYAGGNEVNTASLTNYLGIVGIGMVFAIITAYIGIKVFSIFRDRKKLSKKEDKRYQEYKTNRKSFKLDLEGKSLMWREIYNYAWRKDKKNPQKGNWDLKSIMRILDYNYNTKHQSYKNRGKSSQQKKLDQTFFDDVMRQFYNEFDYNGEAIQFFNRKIINALTISLNHKVFNKGEAVHFGWKEVKSTTIGMDVEKDYFPESLRETIFQEEFSKFVTHLILAVIANYKKTFGDLAKEDLKPLLKDIKIDLLVLKDIYSLDNDWIAFLSDNGPDMDHLTPDEKNVSLYDLREFVEYIRFVTNRGLRPQRSLNPQKYTFFKIAA